jgi:hypothetical protein
MDSALIQDGLDELEKEEEIAVDFSEPNDGIDIIIDDGGINNDEDETGIIDSDFDEPEEKPEPLNKPLSKAERRLLRRK